MSDVSIIEETRRPRRVPAPLPPGLTPLAVTIPQAAQYIGRCVSFIYEALADGRLQSKKSDKRTLVTVQSLNDYFDSLPAAKIKLTTKRRRQLTQAEARAA